jgi:hypothetical protein
MTVEADEVCLNSVPRFVPLLLTRSTLVLQCLLGLLDDGLVDRRFPHGILETVLMYAINDETHCRVIIGWASFHCMSPFNVGYKLR